MNIEPIPITHDRRLDLDFDDVAREARSAFRRLTERSRVSRAVRSLGGGLCPILGSVAAGVILVGLIRLAG